MMSASAFPVSSRIAVITALIAASIVLAGCSTAATPPDTKPAATPTESAGYFEDVDANFAVTFPEEPSVVGADDGGMRASYSTGADPTAPDAVYYTARGTTATGVEIETETLDGAFFQMINRGAILTGPEEEFELEGMPAIMNSFTDPAGKPATMVVAGEGHRYYQLVVVGGTPEERQTFFDSFILLG